MAFLRLSEFHQSILIPVLLVRIRYSTSKIRFDPAPTQAFAERVDVDTSLGIRREFAVDLLLVCCLVEKICEKVGILALLSPTNGSIFAKLQDCMSDTTNGLVVYEGP